MFLLAVSTIGAGIGSLAVINDTFTTTDNFTVATLDLTGNGLQSVNHDFAALFNGDAYADSFAIEIKNEGTTQARYSIDNTGSTGDPSWSSIAFHVHSVANAAACTNALTGSGSLASGTVTSISLGDSTAGQQPGDRLLNAGQSEFICLVARHASPSGISGIYTQQINFRGESTYQNP